MTEIVKICKLHGELPRELTVNNSKTKKGVKYTWLKCRLCQRDKDRDYWHRNRDKKIQQKREYNERQGERLRVKRREYEAAQRATLSNRYVANKMVEGTTIKPSQMPIKLIEFKRVIMQLKRRMKEKNVDKKHNTTKGTCDRDIDAIGG
jgi:hypothetical protein